MTLDVDEAKEWSLAHEEAWSGKRKGAWVEAVRAVNKMHYDKGVYLPSLLGSSSWLWVVVKWVNHEWARRCWDATNAF